MIQCVIFDCDGTLVDSEYLCNLALEKKLMEIGISENATSLQQRFRGWKLANIITSLSQKHQISFDDSFVLHYRELVAELFDENLKPMPNVQTALEKINLAKCVASSGPMEKIRHSLSVSKLTVFFGSHLFSSYEIQSWKPEPDLFLYAANVMGFPPEQCAVIEDSSLGIEAANNAGMKSFYYNPENTVSNNIDAHIEFNDMASLPSLLMLN